MGWSKLLIANFVLFSIAGCQSGNLSSLPILALSTLDQDPKQKGVDANDPASVLAAIENCMAKPDYCDIPVNSITPAGFEAAPPGGEIAYDLSFVGKTENGDTVGSYVYEVPILLLTAQTSQLTIDTSEMNLLNLTIDNPTYQIELLKFSHISHIATQESQIRIQLPTNIPVGTDLTFVGVGVKDGEVSFVTEFFRGFVEEDHLFAMGTGEDHRFGQGVVVSDDLMAVTSRGSLSSGDEEIELYRRDPQSGEYIAFQKIVDSLGTSSKLASRMTFKEDRLFVNNPGGGGVNGKGHVHSFKLNEATGLYEKEPHTFYGMAGQFEFGYDFDVTSLNGTPFTIVGDPGYSVGGANQGQLLIHRFEDDKWVFKKRMTLKDLDGFETVCPFGGGLPENCKNNRFGTSIQIIDNIVLVGALKSFDDNRGAVYVLEMTETSYMNNGEVVHTAQLEHIDTLKIESAGGEKFGSSLSIIPETGELLVGAPKYGADQNDTGAAFIFKRIAHSDWELSQTFSSANGDQEGTGVTELGRTVTANDNIIAIATGNNLVWIYVRNSSDDEWIFSHAFEPSPTYFVESSIGSTMAISDWNQVFMNDPNYSPFWMYSRHGRVMQKDMNFAF